MKKRILFVCIVCIFVTGMLGAAVTTDQWAADYSLFQDFMNATPKDYAAAANVTRKWVEYADQDAAGVAAAAGEGVTKESLTAALNNVYREAAGVICNDYNSLMNVDAVKAAEYAINIQKFFRENPAMFEEFAAANNSSVAAMRQVMDQAIKDGILKTYAVAAAEYSQLAKAGKHDEAARVSANWLRVVSAWNATNSPIPEAFNSFAGVDTQATVTDIKGFERDHAAWREAVARGDATLAFSLVDKWVTFERENPQRASAMQYLYNASSGSSASDTTDWKTVFKVATYVQLWSYDVRAYQTAIAEGRLADAIALLKKWEAVFAGEFGDAICRDLNFGYDKTTAVANLVTERNKLENVNPANTSATVAEFRTDLAEHGVRSAELAAAEPGSDAWYAAAARAAELADKWSKIAAENPALAAEILTATGITLPKDADDNIKQILQGTVNDSAAKFNAALGSGNLQGALDVIKVWDEYLKGHSRAAEIAEATWPGIGATLERFKTGLAIMTATEQPAAPAATEQTPQGTLGVSGQ
ncbi:MAG: hypothetical protein CVV41_06430 [Candidatus Riflebacteria bacterium HGW-Riflebacteria-1]|jgi:hypothetical protein|nr:MAG: hypothetical protein CVV41_06430 [Candidatus Riflebacteria bacterium HGW-Riflebacteria-1]